MGMGPLPGVVVGAMVNAAVLRITVDDHILLRPTSWGATGWSPWYESSGPFFGASWRHNYWRSE